MSSDQDLALLFLCNRRWNKSAVLMLTAPQLYNCHAPQRRSRRTEAKTISMIGEANFEANFEANQRSEVKGVQ